MSDMTTNTITKVVKNLIAGIFIGISNVIPGVSGGTIACVFDSYENMLSLPSFNIKRIKQEYRAIIALYFGMAFGILIFAKLVKFVYENYPIHTSYFFVGIVFGSLFFLYDKACEKKEDIDANPSNKYFKQGMKVFLFACGFALMTSLYVLKRKGIVLPFHWDASNHSFIFYFMLFIYCAVASAGMIIPGISGSFILLLLGAYKIVIEAVASFNLKLLCVIGAGVVCGALDTARLVKFLIERFSSFSYAFILGLTMGSILHIFPIVCQPFNQRLISAIMLLLGYVVVTIFTGRNVKDRIKEMNNE